MTCLKACPHRSVELNLRPPGIELWTTHTATAYEVALLFLLLGSVFLHRLPELNDFWGLHLNLDNFAVHAGLSVVVLGGPGLLALAIHGLVRVVNQRLKPRSFIELAYGYLPLVLGSTLAHYLRLGLTEGGRIIPVTLATFGLSSVNAPVVVADPAVIAFLQSVTLLAAALLSMILTQNIARQSFRHLLPQHLAIWGFTGLFWQLIV
jgi:polyferredoxin